MSSVDGLDREGCVWLVRSRFVPKIRMRKIVGEETAIPAGTANKIQSRVRLGVDMRIL